MVSSPFCQKHIVFAKRAHGYLEGAQHLRPTKYKESAYDTSVILLQSKKAISVKSKELLKKFESDLRTAFASRHSVEIAERRKGDKK